MLSDVFEIFLEIFETSNLTLQVEISYDSSSYCEKLERRIVGPWYAGLAGYLFEKESMRLDFKKWQNQLLKLISVDFTALAIKTHIQF